MTVAPLTPRDPEPLVTRREMARLLGISVTSLDKLRQDPSFPEESAAWGLRVVRFAPTRVRAWLAARDQTKEVRAA